MCGESIEMAVQYKDGALHDSALSLNYTVISIDSPHMRSNYLKYLLTLFKKLFLRGLGVSFQWVFKDQLRSKLLKIPNF